MRARSRTFLWLSRRDVRGVVAVLIALLLPLFVGFMALSVDTAVIAAARGQLSTAADAASLAAAQQLATEARIRGSTDLTNEITLANAKAASFALANHVLGQGPQIVQNPSNGAAGDVLVGYLDPTNPHATFQTGTAYISEYNSVRVCLERSANRNGVVPTFFASLMGFRGSSVQVQSTATAQNYTISGFKSFNGLSAHMLPIVLDITTYHAMLAGTTTDQYKYNPATKTVTSGTDGVTESKLYPVVSGSPGNWGTVKVGVSNNSTAVLSDQILNGISPAQLATFPGGTIALDTTQTPPPLTLSGNPGISAGIKSALTSIIGQPVTIPIYDTNGGNGNNAWYRVIAFAGVRILDVNFQGNPKYVIIQPALVTDPTARRGGPAASWTDGGLVVLHLTQ
jgi:Flp pilus assembly protein TadG